MKKILFVCLGNICRSPSAEAIFKSLLKEKKLEDKYFIDSAGTSNYHEGELADERMRSFLTKAGYTSSSISRGIKKEDFDKFDLIVGMDRKNIRDLGQMASLYLEEKEKEKIKLMTSFSTVFDDDGVPDPYYGGDEGFIHVIELLEDCCQGLLNYIQEKSF